MSLNQGFGSTSNVFNSNDLAYSCPASTTLNIYPLLFVTSSDPLNQYAGGYFTAAIRGYYAILYAVELRSSGAIAAYSNVYKNGVNLILTTAGTTYTTVVFLNGTTDNVAFSTYVSNSSVSTANLVSRVTIFKLF